MGFASLLSEVVDRAGFAPALDKKDDWTTHGLGARHKTGLDIWFKAGTSLANVFGIIERFRLDLARTMTRPTAALTPLLQTVADA